jgi:hypothetical protein
MTAHRHGLVQTSIKTVMEVKLVLLIQLIQIYMESYPPNFYGHKAWRWRHVHLDFISAGCKVDRWGKFVT